MTQNGECVLCIKIFLCLYDCEYPGDQMDNTLASEWPVSAQGSGLMRMPVYGVTDRG